MPTVAGTSGLVGELWDTIWNLPGMLLAVAGTLCLVMVVVTSIRVARRRLRNESRHLIHLYAYLGRSGPAAPAVDRWAAVGLRATVKALGDDSALVASLQPGTQVLIEGPYGRLTAERASTGKGTQAP